VGARPRLLTACSPPPAAQAELNRVRAKPTVRRHGRAVSDKTTVQSQGMAEIPRRRTRTLYTRRAVYVCVGGFPRAHLAAHVRRAVESSRVHAGRVDRRHTELRARHTRLCSMCVRGCVFVRGMFSVQ
jgi:hypothetical protein